MARFIIDKVIYVVTQNPNGLYKSEDDGATFTLVTSNILTNEVQDIAVSDRDSKDIVITYGNSNATSIYRSSDYGETFVAGENTFGKSVTFVGNNSFVFGGIRSISGSGARMGVSLNNGATITSTIDVTRLFDYPGAIYNNITITGFDFLNPVGGYITIAGDQNNSAADQILTRTYDRGLTFPDALILPGNMGIIRDVWANPDVNVVFAIGEPDTLRGVLYSVNPSLTEAPVKVLDNITVGSITNNTTVKFVPVPPVYDDPRPPQNTDPSAGNILARTRVYFLDSVGRLYYSTDSGFTWTFKSTIPGQPVDMIAISENVLLVLCKSPSIVYKSVDGGTTFIPNPQPSWTNPKAISFSSSPNCERCPEAYETVAADVLPNRCTRNEIVGPLCKSPYQYSEVFEACVKPSTIVPSNIVLSFDYSGSVGTLERLLFREFLQLFITKVEDRLLDESMKIAIVGWSDTACLQQPFTSNIADLRAAINTSPPDSCSANGTNHVAAMCVSIRALYEESVLRPDAENVIILFTDGSQANVPDGIPELGCDLSDIGLLPIVTIANNFSTSNNAINNSMFALLRNAKTQLNNNTGMKVMAVTLGNTTERILTQRFLVTDPAGLRGADWAIPSILPSNGNYYNFDAGTFDSAAFIADQVRLGLAAEVISSPQCPTGTFGVGGQDNLGYCRANENFTSPQCTAILTDCAGIIPPFEARVDNLSSGSIDGLGLDGKVITLSNLNASYIYYPGCFKVNKATELNPNPSALPLAVPGGQDPSIFFTCPECSGQPEPTYYKISNCDGSLESLFTIEDLSSYISAGTPVVTNSIYPGCWIIDTATPANYTLIDDFVSGIGLALTGCGLCPRAALVFKLTDYCNDPNNFIYTQDNVLAYLGQVVKLDISATTCWTVELTADEPPIIQPVVITASFADCIECNPPQIYEFVNCEDENSKVSTTNDFSQYDGQVVRLQQYPGNCWTCNAVAASAAPREQLTIDGEPFAGCPECLTTYYQLTNCVNPDVFLISSSLELSRYLGRTITAAGFPSLCFTVTQPKCDCVRIIVNDIQYDVNKAPTIYNGRTLYLFESESGDSLGLAWNNNPSRWELFNTQTLETYGFSTRDTECPFSNLWTIQQGSPYIITGVSFCVERIYNIAPELDFDNCDPCIKCI
jgi:hypothetical protein